MPLVHLSFLTPTPNLRPGPLCQKRVGAGEDITTTATEAEETTATGASTRRAGAGGGAATGRNPAAAGVAISCFALAFSARHGDVEQGQWMLRRAWCCRSGSRSCGLCSTFLPVCTGFHTSSCRCGIGCRWWHGLIAGCFAVVCHRCCGIRGTRRLTVPSGSRRRDRLLKLLLLLSV